MARIRKIFLLALLVDIVISIVIAIALIGTAWSKETTEVTTVERTMPISCVRDEANKVIRCSSTKVTAETTTMTAPLPKRTPKRKDEEEV